MKRWNMSVDKMNLASLEEAAELLRAGEIVAFPTETVYGLGGNGIDPKAIKKIFKAKGRPSDNPLILHLASEADVSFWVTDISPSAKLLMDKFWPGPLTLILPKNEKVPLEATGGLSSVALRVPGHPIARKLIELAKIPIAAPSANLSGKPSPTSGAGVIEDLGSVIAGIIDGGETEIGLESTVLDCTEEIPVILRPGVITQEMLEEVIGIVLYDPALKNDKETPKAPGMKYRHYAPEGKLTILKDCEDLKEALEYVTAGNIRGAFVIPEEWVSLLEESKVRREIVGSSKSSELLATRFYEILRKFDREKINEIFVSAVPEQGIGIALMNRMKKAAGNIWWT